LERCRSELDKLVIRDWHQAKERSTLNLSPVKKTISQNLWSRINSN